MRNRLTTYLLGSTLLLFSEGLYDLAFAIYAYQISGKASVGAITYALGYLAEILTSLFGGGFLDRYSKLRIFTVTISLKVAVFLSLVYWGHQFGMGEFTIWFFAFVIDAIHHYSKLNNMTAVADLFQGEDHIQAHGYLASIQGTARIAGPLLGSSIIAWFGPIDALIFCAAFQVTALVLFHHAFKGTPEKKRSATDNSKAALGTLKALREIANSPFWRRYLTLDALTTLFVGTSVLLTVPLLKQLFNVNDQDIGIFYALGAAGSIAGGFLLTKNFRRMKFGHWSALMTAIQGSLLIGLIFSPVLTVAALLKCFLDFSITSYFRGAVIYLQTQAPAEQKSAYYTASDAVSRSLGLVGILVGGFVFDSVGYQAIYIAMGLGLMVVACGWLNFAAHRYQ